CADSGIETHTQMRPAKILRYFMGESLPPGLGNLILNAYHIGKKPIGALYSGRQLPEKGVARVDVSSLSVFCDYKTTGATRFARIGSFKRGCVSRIPRA